MDIVFEPGKGEEKMEDEVANYVKDNEILLALGIPAIVIWEGFDLDGKVRNMGNVFELGKLAFSGLKHTSKFKRCLIDFDPNTGITYVMFTQNSDSSLPEVLSMVTQGSC